MSQSEMKVGFLCSHAPIKQWQLSCIQEVATLNNIEIHILYCHTQSQAVTTKQQNGIIKKTSLLRKYLSGPWRLWNVFYYLFVQDKVSHFRPVDSADFLKKFRRIELLLNKNGFKYSFTAESVTELKKNEFDVLINLELGFLTGEVLSIPRHGVWSFHHGDEEKYRGLPPGFWEIYQADPVCGLVLQRLTDELDAGYILEKGFVPTNLRSYRRTLENLFSVGHQWPAKICRRIQQTDYSTLATKSKTRAKVLIAPNNFQMLRFAFKLINRNLKYLFGNFLKAELWRVGVIEAPISLFVDKQFSSAKPYWLPIKEKTVFKADPFSYPSSEGPRIIFESFDYRTRIGKISSTRFDSKTKIFEPTRLEIAKPYHLSYPFIFSYQNQTYSLVETYTENKMSFFLLTKDGQWIPYKEVPSKIFRNDNTLFEHEGRWYLFWTEGALTANMNLNIAYADSPFGPFTDHLLNPVKIDIKSSRAAGALFKKEGLIYRPSQNSTHGYGSGISIHHIIKLSPTEYEEKLVNELKAPASWGHFEGLHTLSILDENTTLIDCKSYEWLWINIVQILKNHLMRLLR